MPVNKDSLTLENLTEASDDVLRAYIAKASASEAVKGAMASRRGQIEADPVSILQDMLEEGEDEEAYTIDDLVQDIQRRKKN